METGQSDLAELIRQEVERAIQAGERPPGRPALVRMTGATDHQVRKALEIVSREPIQQIRQPGDTKKPEPELTDQPSLQVSPRSTPAQAPTSVEIKVSGEKLPKPWPLAFIALAAAVAIWGGWVRLGELTGFGPINLFPGIGSGFTVNTAVVLPLSVEFYSAYALRVLFTSCYLSTRTRKFAKLTFIASLATGVGAQIASHVLEANGFHQAPDLVVTLVACVPVLVLGLATGLATLVKHDQSVGDDRG